MNNIVFGKPRGFVTNLNIQSHIVDIRRVVPEELKSHVVTDTQLNTIFNAPYYGRFITKMFGNVLVMLDTKPNLFNDVDSRLTRVLREPNRGPSENRQTNNNNGSLLSYSTNVLDYKRSFLFVTEPKEQSEQGQKHIFLGIELEYNTKRVALSTLTGNSNDYPTATLVKILLIQSLVITALLSLIPLQDLTVLRLLQYLQLLSIIRKCLIKTSLMLTYLMLITKGLQHLILVDCTCILVSKS